MKKTAAAPVKKKTPQRGVFVYKPINSIILVCTCGNKYVSTRLKQTTCIQCMPRK